MARYNKKGGSAASDAVSKTVSNAAYNTLTKNFTNKVGGSFLSALGTTNEAFTNYANTDASARFNSTLPGNVSAIASAVLPKAAPNATKAAPNATKAAPNATKAANANAKAANTKTAANAKAAVNATKAAPNATKAANTKVTANATKAAPNATKTAANAKAANAAPKAGGSKKKVGGGNVKPMHALNSTVNVRNLFHQKIGGGDPATMIDTGSLYKAPEIRNSTEINDLLSQEAVRGVNAVNKFVKYGHVSDYVAPPFKYGGNKAKDAEAPQKKKPAKKPVKKQPVKK